MASVYEKQGKYWLRYFDPDTNRWRDKPTPLKAPQDARKAKALKNLTTAAELEHRGPRQRSDERWEAWVADYLAKRYCEAPDTLRRYRNSWSHLELFLDEFNISAPAAWKHEHNQQYVDWKLKQNKGKRDARYSRPSAVWDLSTMTLVMNEAKRRDFVTENRVSKKRIAKGKTKVKPLFTEDQIALVRNELKLAAAGKVTAVRGAKARQSLLNLSIAFEIALFTGCRLAETSIDFKHIDFERETITFIDPKGGPDRAFTVPILQKEFRTWLATLKKARIAAKFSTTCDLHGSSSRDFERACARVGLPDHSFHCTRVTFVTRALESGLAGEIVRKLVRHADAIINRIYQRISIEGLRGLGGKVDLPAASFPDVGPKTFSATPTPHP